MKQGSQPVRMALPSGVFSGHTIGPDRLSHCLLPQYEDHRAHWDINQAGLSHSHQHGFGLLNAWRLVNAAKVPPASTGLQGCIFFGGGLVLLSGLNPPRKRLRSASLRP